MSLIAVALFVAHTYSLPPSQSGGCRIAHSISSIETRSLPTLTRSYPCRFTLITRIARARASYPGCVVVYPRD
jgi:hypothetical protein